MNNLITRPIIIIIMRTIKSHAYFMILIFCILTNPSLFFSPIEQQYQTYSLQPPSSCTPNQIAIAKDAISTCEATITDTTALLKCISSQITKNSSQLWNIYYKNTPQNSDVIMYWISDNCSVNLQNYGKFERNYVMWPVESYLDVSTGQQGKISTRKNHFLEQIKSTREKHIQTNHVQTSDNLTDNLTDNLSDKLTFTCPQWKLTQVQNILTGCDISGNNRAGQCIVQRIKDQLSQKWDVLVATSLQSDLNWYSFNGCSRQLNFGTYGRRIYVWKATEL